MFVTQKKIHAALTTRNTSRHVTEFFDKKWEDNDINSDVDVCLITGQPGPNDNGRNEILLSGRIYKSGFQIPICSDQIKNQFLQSCLSRISKMGYETHHLGGSAGNEGATVDQLQYFEKHRGSCPNVNGAVVHIPKDDGTWQAYYISPYKKRKKKWPLRFHTVLPNQADRLNGEKTLMIYTQHFLIKCQKFVSPCLVF
jgi:hypothetical protein